MSLKYSEKTSFSWGENSFSKASRNFMWTFRKFSRYLGGDCNLVICVNKRWNRTTHQLVYMSPKVKKIGILKKIKLKMESDRIFWENFIFSGETFWEVLLTFSRYLGIPPNIRNITFTSLFRNHKNDFVISKWAMFAQGYLFRALFMKNILKRILFLS